MTRRDSALHASCTGGVVDLADARPLTEDEVQICAVSVITLPYCPRTRHVLTAEYRSVDIHDAVNGAATKLLKLFGHVRVTDVTVRPWQRWWRKTPAKRLIPSELRSAVERHHP